MDTGLKLLIQNLKSPSEPLRSSPMSFLSFRQLTNHFSIRRKIGCGFGLAIGVMLFGMASGRIIDLFYWEYAKEQLSRTDTEVGLVMQVQNLLLHIHDREQQITATDIELKELRSQAQKLVTEAIQVRDLLQEMTKILKSQEKENSQRGEEEASVTKKIKVLQECSTFINVYINKITLILESDRQTVVSSPKEKTFRQAMLKFPYTDAGRNVDRVPSYIQKITAGYEDEEERNIQTLNQTRTLELVLLLFCTLISLAIATAIAIHISGAISLPIKMTTQVALRMAETSNFNLRAPIISKDEVGQLAIALNQLIKRIKSHTEELRNAQTQLIQSEKMSSLGQMVAGIAHELNNPTNFIHGNVQYASDYVHSLLKIVQLYQQEYPHPTDAFQEKIQALELEFLVEDLEKTLISMKIGTERIRQLVLSLRNFSRLDEAEVKAVDLHEGIENTLLILNHRLQPNITIHKNYGDLPLVDCYPAQINQVFMNIINNAIDALLDNHSISNKQILIQTKYLGSDRVEIRIRDNGSGIPETIQKKIFDPFFTTKEVGKGTGLGLAICYQVVQKHSGDIQVNPRVNKGTEFVLTLPVHQMTTQTQAFA